MNFAAAAKRSLPSGAAAAAAAAATAAGSAGAAASRAASSAQRLLKGLFGRLLTLTATDGRTFQGVLVAISSDAYTLQMVQEVPQGVLPSTCPFNQSRVFKFSEVSRVCVDGQQKAALVESACSSQLRTDSDISSAHLGRENRRLEKWLAEDSDNTSEILSLDQETRLRPDGRGWNQFEVNAKLFGYETSYNQENYTTAVDRDSAFYRQNEQRAEQLAREIEAEATSNPHIAEERGHEVTGRELDSEERFSTVLNGDINTSRVKYQIPAKRATTLPRTASSPSKSVPSQSPSQSASAAADTTTHPASAAADTTTHPVSAAADTTTHPASAAASSTTQSLAASSSPSIAASATPSTAETHRISDSQENEATKNKPDETQPKVTGETSSSKLNPNAKEFSLSASAKEFVPTFGGSSATMGGYYVVQPMVMQMPQGGYQQVHPMMPYAPYGYGQPPLPPYAQVNFPAGASGHQPQMMGRGASRGRPGSRGRGRGRGRIGTHTHGQSRSPKTGHAMACSTTAHESEKQTQGGASSAKPSS